MAYSQDSFYGTSDELVDPYCDPCNAKGLNVRVCGFCKDCVQFLCTDCQGVHGNLQACRHHDVVQGKDMPKSQADKPPRFDHCDVHPRLLKDQFCCGHKILLCSLCTSSDHKGCSMKTVQDACKNIDNSETDALHKNIKCLQDNLKSTLPLVDKEIKNIKDQEKAMLSDAEKIYYQMIAKAKNMFGSITNEIQTSCQSQISELSRHQKKVNDTITKLDSPLSELREQKNKTVDAKLFIKIQDIVSHITKFTTETHESSKTLKFGSLSFVPSQSLKEFLSSPFTIGAIRRSESKTDAEFLVPEIMFPVSPPKKTTSRPQARQAPGNQNLGRAPSKSVQASGNQNLGGAQSKSVQASGNQNLGGAPSKPVQTSGNQNVGGAPCKSAQASGNQNLRETLCKFVQALGNQNLGGAPFNPVQTQSTNKVGMLAAKPLLPKPIKPLSKIKADKQGTYNTKQRRDRNTCNVTGMTIFNDRRIVIADNWNNNFKMLCHDMKFLSSVSVPDKPLDIAVTSDREAVATTDNKSLVILDISGSQLSIKKTTQLSYDVRGISRYNDKLVVTSPDSKPPSVKLINQAGRVYWSVTSDQQGQPLFSRPMYVSSHGDGRSSTVIVTDWSHGTLTLLNGDTGEVITRHQLKERKNPESITTDSDGNVYVCYSWTSEVAVLSGNLNKEKILLSEQDGLDDKPQAILYDDKAKQLTISYGQGYNNVDRFQLS